jgi:hypothetical protein
MICQTPLPHLVQEDDSGGITVISNLIVSQTVKPAALKKLTIATVGARGPMRGESTRMRYRAIAKLIATFHSTLQHLTSEQSPDNGPMWRGPCGTTRFVYGQKKMRQKYRPMDDMFMEIIYPVLLQDTWPQLKRIEILGVGEWP